MEGGELVMDLIAFDSTEEIASVEIIAGTKSIPMILDCLPFFILKPPLVSACEHTPSATLTL